MTDSNANDTPSTDETPRPPAPPRRPGRRWLFLALPAVLLGGALGARAYAFGPRGDMSPEQMDRFIERRIEGFLDGVDATDDQRTRIKATLARLRPEMKALHADKARLRDAGKKALAANPLDAAEVERLRREVLALADKGTSLMSRALVEVGNTLTPEQRREVLQHLERRHGRWH